MKRILYVQSSLQGEQGASSGLGSELVAALQASHPGSLVTTLDLASDSPPHLDAEELAAWRVAPEDRTPRQARLAQRSDALIDQLLAHDTLVLAVPMYNLTVPSTLKAWIDRIARAGRTFRYTADGPVGLVRGMDAYAVFARGGAYQGTPLDTQTSYVKAILGLVGIDDLKTVFAEGLALGDGARARSIDQARDVIGSLTASYSEGVRYASA